MASRTLEVMLAELQRAFGAVNVPLLEIRDALTTANKEINDSNEWPWVYGQTNILIPPVYTTGTVSVVDGTATVTGAGTAWSPLWTGRVFRFGTGNVDYVVSTFGGAGTATLDQVVNLGSNLTNSTYSIYKDRHEMPVDFVPGGDLLMGQPELRYRIKHIPRYTLEQQALFLKQTYGPQTLFYSDYGVTSIGGVNTYWIKFMPPPTQTGQYRLVYKRKAPDLTIPTECTWLPQGWDEVVMLLAEVQIRTRYQLPGAQDAATKAQAKLKVMRKAMSGSIDNQPRHIAMPPDSSVSDFGLGIASRVP